MWEKKKGALQGKLISKQAARIHFLSDDKGFIMHSHTHICDTSLTNFCTQLFLGKRGDPLKELLASPSLGLGERLLDNIFENMVKE